MPKFDRGMIKWQPFNSVVPSKQLVNEIMKEKSKIKMPILSEEQKSSIEKKIILSFYENEPITLEYFYHGKILKANDIIKKIDSTYHKIYFNNKVILFDQIIKIY